MSIKNYILAKLELGIPVNVLYISPTACGEALSGTVIGYDNDKSEPWIVQCDDSNDFDDWEPQDIADYLENPCHVLDDPTQFIEMVGDPIGGLLLKKAQKAFMEKELPTYRPIRRDGEIVGYIPAAPKFSFPDEDLPTIAVSPTFEEK